LIYGRQKPNLQCGSIDEGKPLLLSEHSSKEKPTAVVNFINILRLHFLYKILVPKMGGIQRAGTGKNEKVTEISPLLAFWPEGLGIKFL